LARRFSRVQLIDSFAPSSLCFLCSLQAKLKSFCFFAQLFFCAIVVVVVVVVISFPFRIIFLFFVFVWFNCRLLLLASWLAVWPSVRLAFPPLELPLLSFLLFAISV